MIALEIILFAFSNFSNLIKTANKLVMVLNLSGNKISDEVKKCSASSYDSFLMLSKPSKK